MRRRWVSPVGIPRMPWIGVVRAADRPRLITANRYPRQVIGVGLRLPKRDDAHGWPYLSVLWSRPARWWGNDRTKSYLKYCEKDNVDPIVSREEWNSWPSVGSP